MAEFQGSKAKQILNSNNNNNKKNPKNTQKNTWTKD
jgi:hypothetical protein